ncbi:MAG: SDR family NAD(P)-dependent oxidoreductase, partial [Nitrospinota bacterium]
MDLMLGGKAAMISGGSKGIGFHIASDLAGEGCHVAISGRTESDLDDARERIAALGRGRVISFHGDMNRKEDCEAFLAA